MKCIRSHKTGEIVRVSDDEAERIVRSKSHHYVSKCHYKEQEARKTAKKAE